MPSPPEARKLAATPARTKRLPITVIIATRNEAANIENCLRALLNVERVVVVDSFSTDGTIDLAQAYGSEVVQFEYKGGYPKKRQWALNNLDIKTPWTMLIDADEQVTHSLWKEIEHVVNSPGCSDAYLGYKEFHFLGKKLRRGGFSHSAVLLFKTGRAQFEQTDGNTANGQDMEVHERLLVDGKVGRLHSPLIHQDFKGLYAYLDRHNKYSTWEAGIRANYFKTGSWGDQTIKARLFGDAQSRRRFLKAIVLRLPFEPWLWFAYHFILRGGIFEGRRGYIAASLRKAYIEQIHAKLYEQRVTEHQPLPSASKNLTT